MKRLLSFLLCASLPATAQIDPQPENRSPMTSQPGRFQFLLGGADSSATGADVSWEQFSMRGGFALRRDVTPDLKLFYGLDYRYTRIDHAANPIGSHLGGLHDLILPASAVYAPADSPWSFFAQISGQLASDFSHITADDFDYSARLGAQYEFTDRFSINFGVARVRNFGEAFVLPAVGITWAPTDNWSFLILGPRITLSHRLNDRVILRAGGFPTGGLWNVEDEAQGSLDYGLASYNAGLGIDFKLRRGVWLSIWGGANFANEVRAERNGTTLFEEDLDNGFFGSIGINLYEW